MTHLFRFDEKIWDSVDYETTYKTAAALEELGLYKPPYNEFDATASLNARVLSDLFNDVPEKVSPVYKSVTFRYTFTPETSKIVFLLKLNDKFYDVAALIRFYESKGLKASAAVHEITVIGSFIMNTLMALLATKNIEKKTERIKKHGPKSRKRPREYDYITTIRIGKITETCRSEGDGHSAVRPHLRRGHIRNQRVGKGLSEIKPIFIAPCFINADENWINNQRKEYRLVA